MSRYWLPVALLVLCVALAGGAAALGEPRDSAAGAPPIVVFQGETLDLSETWTTDGHRFGTGGGEFYGIGPNNRGHSFRFANARSVDTTRIRPGPYDLVGDRKADVVVREPRVSHVEVRTSDGAIVSDARAPNESLVTVRPSFNFHSASGAELVVRGPDGRRVTTDVANETRFVRSDDAIQVDFAGHDPGPYTISVSGIGVRARTSTRVTVAANDTLVALNRNHAARGQRVRASVYGPPNGTAHIWVPARALRSEIEDGVAERLYEGGSVTGRTADPDRGIVGATVALDDDGTGHVAIDTGAVQLGNVTVRAGGGARVGQRQDDQAALRVGDERILVDRPPELLTAGDRIVLTGSALRSETVAAYALVDGRWVPLRADGVSGRPSTARVDPDDGFRLPIDTARVVNQPGEHRIGIAADVNDRFDDRSTLSRSQFRNLPSTSFGVRTTAPAAAVSAQPAIAAGVGDDLPVSGSASGGGSRVDLFGIRPDGRVITATRTRVAAGGTFTDRIGPIDHNGTYTVLVGTPGRDGLFPPTADPGTLRGATRFVDRGRTLDRIERAYTHGSDGAVGVRTVTAGPPRTTVDRVQAYPGSATRFYVAGGSNRQDGTTVTVEATRGNETIATTTATVDGATGQWDTVVDEANLENATVMARTAGASASR